jgi:hypothetical protein
VADESTLIWGDCYDSFDGPKIILILRSGQAAEWLRNFLKNLPAAPETASLASQAEVTMANRGDLVFAQVEEGTPTRLRRRGAGDPPSYLWTVNPSGIESLLGLIEPLREGHGGHQYLSEIGEADAEIELTYGEEHRVSPNAPAWVAAGGDLFVAKQNQRP